MKRIRGITGGTAAVLLVFLLSACAIRYETPAARTAFESASIFSECPPAGGVFGEYIYEAQGGRYTLRIGNYRERLTMLWSKPGNTFAYELILADDGTLHVRTKADAKAEESNDAELRKSLRFIRDWLTEPRRTVRSVSLMEQTANRTILKLEMNGGYPFDSMCLKLDRAGRTAELECEPLKENPGTVFRVKFSGYRKIGGRELAGTADSEILHWKHRLALKEFKQMP